MSWDYAAYFKPSGGNRVHLAVSNNTPTVSSDNSVTFSYNSSMGIDHSVGISDATSVGIGLAADFSLSVSTSYNNAIPSLDFDFGSEDPTLQAAVMIPTATGITRNDVYLSSAWYRAAFDTVQITALGPSSVTAPSWATARYAFFGADMAVLLMAMICHGVLQDKGSAWLAKDSGGVGNRQAARDLANTMTAAVPALRLSLGLAKLVYGVYMIYRELDASQGGSIQGTSIWDDLPGLTLRNAQSTPAAKSARIYCGERSFIELAPDKITICAPAIELVNDAPSTAVTTVPLPASSPITLRSSSGDVLLDGKTVTVASQSGTTVRGDVTTEANVTVGRSFTVNGQTTTVKDIAAVKLTAQTGAFG